MPATPSLIAALRRDTVSVIAEIKRRSPSKGAINAGLDSAGQARSYEAGGAAAISVLTEPESFGGDNDDLIAAAQASGLPILKKDFHVSEVQLLEARRIGASAALIIVRAIEPSRLSSLADAARELSLELLFEVRTEREIDRALSAGAVMIGVNNRNLETLEMEPGTALRLIPMIPLECIAIAESGYATRAEVTEAARAGADAVLVGSSLSAAGNPADAVKAITGVSRIRRGE